MIMGDWVMGNKVEQRGRYNQYIEDAHTVNQAANAVDDRALAEAANELNSILVEFRQQADALRALTHRDEDALRPHLVRHHGKLLKTLIAIREGAADALDTLLDSPSASFVISVLRSMTGF